jgi:hypothetical protein
MAYVTEKRLQ